MGRVTAAVPFSDHQNVAGAERIDGALELRPVHPRAEHLMGPEDLINATLAVVALIAGLMWASIGWGIARLWRRRRSRRAILRRLKQ